MRRRRRADPDLPLHIIMAVCTIALLVGAVWLGQKIPCDFYSFSSMKDVPARCFMQ